MAMEASLVLQAALQQIDNIIAGSRATAYVCEFLQSQPGTENQATKQMSSTENNSVGSKHELPVMLTDEADKQEPHLMQQLRDRVLQLEADRNQCQIQLLAAEVRHMCVMLCCMIRCYIPIQAEVNKLQLQLALRDTNLPKCLCRAQRPQSPAHLPSRTQCGSMDEMQNGLKDIRKCPTLPGNVAITEVSPHNKNSSSHMNNPQERKKLQQELQTISNTASSQLDHNWVTCWLDDLGLPQYKQQFEQARVDGRRLQFLTVEDLLLLGVNSQLHHRSIRFALQVLQANNFSPNCLQRRPACKNKPEPQDVLLWSNHCVMEWLRSVDLAEFVPHLRGSGVHGGLMMLDPCFDAHTLCLLLNIPEQKTLLRRHLSFSFISLIGPAAQQQKVEYMQRCGQRPLPITARVKPNRRSCCVFTYMWRRKRRSQSTTYILAKAESSLHVESCGRGGAAEQPVLVSDTCPMNTSHLLARRRICVLTVHQRNHAVKPSLHATRLLTRVLALNSFTLAVSQK